MLSAKLARLGQPSNARWPFVGRRRQPTASFAAAEVLLLWSSMATLAPAAAAAELRVETALSFTGRMCAATRWAETQRADAMFADPLAYKLAGAEGRAAPMGEWIMVPRTKYGDGEGCCFTFSFLWQPFEKYGTFNRETYRTDRESVALQTCCSSAIRRKGAGSWCCLARAWTLVRTEWMGWKSCACSKSISKQLST
eukprot:SAG31_NODE_531_length_14413_cov_7.712659_3_plen_197_part_00